MLLCSYQRAFVDFFEDQLVRFGYDWQELIKNFLFEGSEPIVNNLIASCKYKSLTMMVFAKHHRSGASFDTYGLRF